MSIFNQTNTNGWIWYQAENMNIFTWKKDIELLNRCLQTIRDSNLEDKNDIEQNILEYKKTWDNKTLYPVLERFNLPVSLLSGWITILDSIIKAVIWS